MKQTKDEFGSPPITKVKYGHPITSIETLRVYFKEWYHE
jgi:hypothetical protein